jgi:hypothetical protein
LKKLAGDLAAPACGLIVCGLIIWAFGFGIGPLIGFLFAIIIANQKFSK